MDKLIEVYLLILALSSIISVIFAASNKQIRISFIAIKSILSVGVLGLIFYCLRLNSAYPDLRLIFIEPFNIDVLLRMNFKKVYLLMVFEFIFFVVSYLLVCYERKKVGILAITSLFYFLLATYLLNINVVLMPILHLFLVLLIFFAWCGLGVRNNYDLSNVKIPYSIIGWNFLGSLLFLSWVTYSYTISAANSFELTAFMDAFRLNIESHTLLILFWGYMICSLLMQPIYPMYSWSLRPGVYTNKSELIILLTSCFYAAQLYLFWGILGDLFKEMLVTVQYYLSAFGFLSAIIASIILFKINNRFIKSNALLMFLCSFVVFSIGFYSENSDLFVYSICILIPIIALINQYKQIVDIKFGSSVAPIALVFLLMIGFPGSPIFYSFVLMGGSLWDLNSPLFIPYVLLWIIYFVSVVHIFNVFLFESKPKDLLRNIKGTKLNRLPIMESCIIVLSIGTYVLSQFINIFFQEERFL